MTLIVVLYVPFYPQMFPCIILGLNFSTLTTSKGEGSAPINTVSNSECIPPHMQYNARTSTSNYMIGQFNPTHIMALIILQDPFSYILIYPVPLKWYLSDFLPLLTSPVC